MRRLVLAIAWAVVVLSAWGLAPSPGAAEGGAATGERLGAALRGLGPTDQVPLIVTFSERPERFFRADAPGEARGKRREALLRALRETAARAQAPVRALLRAAGGRNLTELWHINALAVTVPAGLVPRIAGAPGVARVDLDEVVMLAAPLPASPTPPAPEWDLAAVGAPEAWAQGFTGEGVVVATMDSGADGTHPDLSPTFRGGANSWFDAFGEYAAPADPLGHGTQVMGLIVGGTAGGSAIGMAPNARWIAARVFDAAGASTLSILHQGFQWLLDPDGDPGTDDAPHIANNSWNLLDKTNLCFQEFAPDIAVMREAGTAVVFSAGNDGPFSPSSGNPANLPGAFAVGATDAANLIAGFSSRGPSACGLRSFPHVVAPGVSVRSAFPGGTWQAATGTSFSAPLAAGGMALLLSARPNLRVSDLEFVLTRSALDLGVAGPDVAYGWGLIDVAKALRTATGGERASGAVGVLLGETADGAVP